jgi:2-succinyl-5-enolpyruvyl-6-hydroxy-3-cyclohexene-1-carboxylate synthase
MNFLWAQAIADELARGGAREAVICPGSRSGLLALACAERLTARTVIDERSAAFFALGAAKATGRPAVVVATSGSAGAHFYPAILEAEAAGIPLIAITADRPRELHGWGAPQSIDQQHLFGRHAQFFELGLPEAAALPHLRATVARAVQCAVGPVHFNAPFREPLVPTGERIDLPDSPAMRWARARGVPDVRGVARELSALPRGVIVCGPRDAQDELPAAVQELSRILGYPVIAEAASQLRYLLDGAVAHADLILRSEPWARALRPQAVVRIGGGLTSKVLQAWISSAGYTAAIYERGEPIDPDLKASVALEGDAPAICSALAAICRPGPAPLVPLFAQAESRARAALAELPWGEPLVAREAARAVPAGGILYVASSMPIRDVDAFASSASAGVRVLANRGVNGIDGVVSSAAGAAAATGRPTLALVGDLALLHDLGGLVAAARLRVPLTVVAVNNDGGGIFHFLPIAQRTDRFDELFATPHGLDLRGVAQLCGAEFARCTDLASLREALRPGFRLIEARTDRIRNVEQHRALHAGVIAALGDAP